MKIRARRYHLETARQLIQAVLGEWKFLLQENVNQLLESILA